MLKFNSKYSFLIILNDRSMIQQTNEDALTLCIMKHFLKRNYITLKVIFLAKEKNTILHNYNVNPGVELSVFLKL